MKISEKIFDYLYNIPYITHMNIEKYKSVAIHKETYDKIRKIAKEDYMSINNFIRKLVDKEHMKFKERKKEENGLAD